MLGGLGQSGQVIECWGHPPTGGPGRALGEVRVRSYAPSTACTGTSDFAVPGHALAQAISYEASRSPGLRFPALEHAPVLRNRDSRIGWIVIRSVLAEAGMDDATLL